MRALVLLILCAIAAACKSPPGAAAKVPVEAPAPPIEAAPITIDAGEPEQAEDAATAEQLFERALTQKNEHPGEAIRLYRKAAQLAANDASLQTKVKEELKSFEPLMRDRAREAY